MQDWPVGKKIVAGFCLILVGAAFGLAVLFYTMNRASTALRQSFDATVHTTMPASDLASSFEREILNARIHFIYFVTIQKAGSLQQGWERYRAAAQILADLTQRVRNQRGLAPLSTSVGNVEGALRAYEPSLKRIIAAVEQGHVRDETFDRLVSEWAAKGGDLVEAARLCEREGQQLALRTAGQADTNLGRGVQIALAVQLAGFLAGAMIAVFTRASVQKNLAQVTAELSQASIQVASAGSQVAASSQALAHGASEQAASLEETSSSASQINSSTHQNASTARQAAQVMAETIHRIQLSNERLNEMVSSMRQIKESSEKVSKVIKVIDEIAFQTNILALNAAVEAARAGDAGLGFAVVANEVRNLAQRSAQAAKDTASLIQESIENSHRAAVKMEEVTAATLSQTEEANKVNGLVAEVDQASQEQARGLEQISKAVVQMEQVTQKTAASAEQAAAAGEELGAQSRALQSLVQRLSAMVGASA